MSGDEEPILSPKPPAPRKKGALQFLLRGLAISLPPILTLIILIWVLRSVNDYIIQPVSSGVRLTIAQFIDASQPTEQFVRWDRLPPLEYCGTDYRVTKDLQAELAKEWQELRKLANTPSEFDFAQQSLSSIVQRNLDRVYVPFGNRSVPYADYAEVATRFGPITEPTTATGVYMELVTARYFGRLLNLSAIAVILVIIALYFLGRFVTVRIGAWMVNTFETNVLARLPLVSNVYSSVKQVTDFLFSERTVEYSRVVAIEYPRKGIWSLALVTSDGMLEITAAAKEPMVAVLVPSSPIPVTGYTMCLPRSEIIDLNLTIDQAFQFCVSCGVLVPPHQKVTAESLQRELAKRLAVNGLPVHRRGVAGDSQAEPLSEGSP